MNNIKIKREMINGFNVTEIFNHDYCSGKYLSLNSKRLNDARETMLEYDIPFLELNIDFHLKNLDFLIDFSFVKGMDIISADMKLDFNGLENLQGLEMFLLKENIPKFSYDFNIFPKLKSCAIFWNRNMRFNSKIEFLSVDKFNQNDLSDISYLINLKDLGISNSNIKSLNGLENFMKLETLSLWYLKNLDSLSPLEKLNNTFKDISVVNCKNIRNYEALYELVNMESFHIADNSNSLKSLDFINKYSKLFSASIFIDVEDQDGTPLQRIPNVSIPPKTKLKNIKSTF
ncbi:MAG: hypothetical protein ACOVRK_10415 [Chryseobacterium taeanense]